MIFMLENPRIAALIFNNWDETLIWSCLDGTMGAIYADDAEKPLSAATVIGDFCFLAGKVNEELFEFSTAILVPQNIEWERAIERYFAQCAARSVRYAFKKEADFDETELKRTVEKLPEGCELKNIDGEIFDYCRRTPWCADFVSQYADYADYARLGLGVVMLERGTVVSGASSYTSYNGGIEIQVDTEPGRRRRGYASVCAAALILRCIEKGLYPSWDAQNKASAALAEKLGYKFSHEYTVYEILKGEVK